MKISMIVLFLMLATSNLPAENAGRIIEDSNKYGGRTIQIDAPDAKRITFRRSLFLLEASSCLINVASSPGNTKWITLTEYYDSKNNLVQDEIEFDPNCDFAKSMRLVREVDYYHAPQDKHNWSPYRTDLFFNAKHAAETGLESMTYTYVIIDKATRKRLPLINPKLTAKSRNKPTPYESMGLPEYDDVVEYHYAREWSDRTGLVTKVILREAGICVSLFNDAFAAKQGYSYRREYYAKIHGRFGGTVNGVKADNGMTGFYYNYSGAEYHRLNNEFGGITVDVVYKGANPFIQWRGITGMAMEYDGNGVLRRATTKGNNIWIRSVFSGDISIDRTVPVKIVDTFDSDGNPTAEEIWNGPLKYPGHAHMKKTYLRDGIQIDVTPYAMSGRDFCITSVRYDENGVKQSQTVSFSRELTAANGYDTEVQLFEKEAYPRFNSKGLQPWEIEKNVGLMKRKYRVQYSLNGAPGKSISDARPVSVSLLDRTRFWTMNIPYCLTVNYNGLSNAIIRFAKTDIEKAYAAFWWTHAFITYDLSCRGKTEAHPYHIIKTRGVCEDYSTTFLYIAFRLGLEVRYVGGHCAGCTAPHAWNRVKIGDRYAPLDCTWGRFFTEPEEFLTRAWPYSPSDQCLPRPYESYSQYKKEKGIKNGSFDRIFKK